MALDGPHKIECRDFVTQPLSMKQFWKDAIDCRNGMKDVTDKVDAAVSEMDIDQLEEDCSLSLTTSGGDIEQVSRESVMDIVSRAFREIPLLTLKEKQIPEKSKSNLLTLQYLERDLERRQNSENHLNAVLSVLKYSTLALDKPLYDPPKSTELQERIRVHEDMTLTVRIHRPTYWQQNARHLRWQFIKYDQQFAVLGRQRLTSLKDKIVCAMDAQLEKLRDDSLMGQFDRPSVKRLYPSSYFFIHDTFYNDLRHPESYDLSEDIRKWGKTAEGVGKMKTANMDETCFEDLTLRLGRPYLYSHAGGCEHLVVFVMARLADSNDPPYVNLYPVLHQVSSKRPAKCMVCNEFTARWAVKNGTRSPYAKMLYCNECYLEFNFDTTGNKTEDFRALPYVDRTDVL